LTQTEKMGFGKNFFDALDEIAPELVGTALDAAKIKRDLLPKYERASRANAKQEEAKRVAAEATAEMDEATDDFYRSCSGFLDAVIGVVGKGTVAARNLGRLRSRIRAPGDQGGEASSPGGVPPTASQ